MRPVAFGVLAALLLLPAALGQTFTQPVQGAYADIYLVAGRAVDSRGEPAAGADLTVELQQPGVRAAPLKATSNCKGDFITYFKLREVTPKGSVTVTLHGRDGVANATARAAFDPFYRRSDLVVQLPGPWEYRCGEKEDVWGISLSVTGRIVNRTEPYEVENVTYQGSPYGASVIRLRYEDAEGRVKCPPAPNAPEGACDFLRIDERGDFRYTFVFDQPVEAAGRMHLILDGIPYSAPVDPLTRQAVLHIEPTGRGPPRQETPGADAFLALAAAGALAALGGLRRRR